ncbi:anthrone oxygenase family protein [Rhodospirillaceae bacterium SYSU D60014]|uniref:anthrone oxygenase family protein n=1 Tax=Virgifigura deserti TaxID=2268457 RepID=UPI000E674672
MVDHLLFVLVFLSALGSGLVAGLFFAFSAFVMTALARLPSAQGIAAMQSINIAVLNALFFAAFFGTAAACAVLAVFSLFNWTEPGAIYLLAGGLLYLVGTILVTILFNVPLNNALAAVEPDSADGASLWTWYLDAWTAWNHARTAASLAAAASFIMALC